MAGFGFTGFLLTRVAMTVTDEDIKASSAPYTLRIVPYLSLTQLASKSNILMWHCKA